MSRVLIVGLGNPGPRYAANRHNIGFMALDAIIRHHGLSAPRRRFEGEVCEGAIDGRDVLALRPLTFMNDSGRSVAAAARFFKIPGDAIFVFHDELDLAAGRVRVKRGGGSAGHNGLRSIDALLGSDYWRVRLGIGHPGQKHRVLGHVLADFAAADAAWLDPLLAALAEHVPLLIEGDAGHFMSKLALAVPQPATAAEQSGIGGAGDAAASGGGAGRGGA
jgi:PTH1 family peptidyl-tRNA hydrolase